MGKRNWEVRFVAVLTLIALAIYGLHILLFHDALYFARCTPDGLASYLKEKRESILALLGNPNLLEHETFTDLLWAVFHLSDELERRTDLAQLQEEDRKHLEGDIQRAYGLLLVEWLEYMRHMKSAYPYLFSLACRTNPFDETACVVITAN